MKNPAFKQEYDALENEFSSAKKGERLSISNEDLCRMDKAMENFEKEIVSDPINLSDF